MNTSTQRQELTHETKRQRAHYQQGLTLVMLPKQKTLRVCQVNSGVSNYPRKQVQQML